MIRLSKPEPDALPTPIIEALFPDAALPGGEVELLGLRLGPVASRRPVAMLGPLSAPVLLTRERRLILRVPDEAETGRLEVFQNGARSNSVELRVAQMIATGVHAVGNPVVDLQGNIFVTFSGPRGQATPVSVFRIEPGDEMRPFVTGLMNATGLAIDAAGYIYASSRQDGTVHRVSPEGASSLYAEGMGIATGIAFDPEQNLYVGDRSGTIFKIAQDRQIFVFATLEPSVAAYHLAFGPDGTLYVTGPTTSSYDNLYAIDGAGVLRVHYRGLGRPQGLAVDVVGNVYVAASLHGKRGIVRITPDGEASLVLAGNGIVGITFASDGNALLTTSSAVYHVALGVEGLRLY
jgi:sugar lactone lactonase YvrE